MSKEIARELGLTQEQTDYLNRKGSPINAAQLKRAYKLSVEDQEKMLEEAEAIRKQKGLDKNNKPIDNSK